MLWISAGCLLSVIIFVGLTRWWSPAVLVPWFMVHFAGMFTAVVAMAHYSADRPGAVLLFVANGFMALAVLAALNEETPSESSEDQQPSDGQGASH